jgi:hypothetical protein
MNVDNSGALGADRGRRPAARLAAAVMVVRELGSRRGRPSLVLGGRTLKASCSRTRLDA